MNKYFSKILRHKTILNVTVGAAMLFMLIGVILWGGFNTALEVTNDMGFCIGCHEMEENVFQEYTHSIHYSNRSGVRATCPDCHVPREWEHMVMRKISASQELFQKILGTIDTPEKFELNRERMAQSVWHSMEATNSRECRNCHNFEAMDLSIQSSRSNLIHSIAQERDQTCINCHQGIAHQLPVGIVAYRGGNDEDHAYFEQKDIPCYSCHEEIAEPDTEEWDWDLD